METNRMRNLYGVVQQGVGAVFVVVALAGLFTSSTGIIRLNNLAVVVFLFQFPLRNIVSFLTYRWLPPLVFSILFYAAGFALFADLAGGTLRWSYAAVLFYLATLYFVVRYAAHITRWHGKLFTLLVFLGSVALLYHGLLAIPWEQVPGTGGAAAVIGSLLWDTFYTLKAFVPA